MGSYDKQTQTCTVGCHNRGGARPTPKWTDVGPLACGDCHSAPPAKHYAGACSTCHREANADGTRVAGPMHLDGKVDLGDGSGKCGACHGQGDDPFPTTRAHPAHANPKITTPVACGTCHVVTAMAPQQIKTPNHMNGKVEVVLGGRALDRGAQPTWDGASCSDVACHGAKLPQQPFVVAPQWADPTHIPAACGACHQIPPTTGHTTSIGCDSVDCHGSIVSLDAKNVPSITSFGKTLHINGQIDRF
jgi:predicted CxxxxCH...CXXCH cytochrome family protein